MELKAKVIQLLPLQQGEGKNGPWKKQDFIVETDGQYPKKVCFSAWGDKINESLIRPGNTINVFFDAESREYNGRWYTDLKVWKLEAIGAGEPAGADSQFNSVNEPAMDILPDDLPF